MPIDYSIDVARRIVVATPRGTLTEEDLLGYQRDVWTRAEVRGFNELVDMSRVEHVEWGSALKVRDIISVAAEMDPPETPSKFAIVAESELHLKLAHMYQAFREAHPKNTRAVRVFTKVEPALQWLLESGA
jgi:hypothetical protein